MLARGEHLAALRERGIEVRSKEETFTARVRAAGDSKELAGFELAIVAVKTYSLDEVAPAARFAAEHGALVLPLLNGVDAADRLLAHGVPREKLLGGLTEISAARVAPGVVEKRSPFARVALGELGGGVSERAEHVAALFREVGVEARVSADIGTDLWRKLSFIASMAAGCGLARAPIGAVREALYGRLLLERAVREAVEVARAHGLLLGDEDVQRAVAFLDALPAAAKPSLLLDLEAGGRTEIDDLCGTIARVGRLHGVATPVHDAAVAALSAVRPV
jgi:2-dehydropantoate 2-reductase